MLRSVQDFPNQGSKEPWRVHQNYALDLLAFRLGGVDDGVMRFSRGGRRVTHSDRGGSAGAVGVTGRLGALPGLPA